VRLIAACLLYCRPFAFRLRRTSSVSDGSDVREIDTSKNGESVPFLLAVYEQPGEKNLDVGVGQKTCDESYADRALKLRNFVDEQGFRGPVAANVIRVPVNTLGAQQMLCHFAKCLGKGFPAGLTIKGVNDKSECQGYNAATKDGLTSVLFLFMLVVISL